MRCHTGGQLTPCGRHSQPRARHCDDARKGRRPTPNLSRWIGAINSPVRLAQAERQSGLDLNAGSTIACDASHWSQSREVARHHARRLFRLARHALKRLDPNQAKLPRGGESAAEPGRFGWQDRQMPEPFPGVLVFLGRGTGRSCAVWASSDFSASESSSNSSATG